MPHADVSIHLSITVGTVCWYLDFKQVPQIHTGRKYSQAQVESFPPPSPAHYHVPAARIRASTVCIVCGWMQVTQFGSIKSCLAF